MSARQKIHDRLDSLELEFRQRLIAQLQSVAAGYNQLFFAATEFNPFPELNHKTPDETDELLSMANEINRLREKLGESSNDTLACRLRAYCRKWADTSDHHRPGARNLAQAFLDEIDART